MTSARPGATSAAPYVRGCASAVAAAASPGNVSGGRARGAHKGGQQAVERPDLDPRIDRGLLDQRDALLQREQRLLRDVDGDRDDDTVGEREGAPDQVFVAARDGVERARVDGDAGHGA